jgi:hypothetical protein
VGPLQALRQQGTQARFPMASAGVRDRLQCGHCRTLGPSAIKVAVAECITYGVDRRLVTVVVDLEPDCAGVLPDRVGRTVKSGRFTVTAGVAGKSGEALQSVRGNPWASTARPRLVPHGRRVLLARAHPGRSRSVRGW